MKGEIMDMKRRGKGREGTLIGREREKEREKET